MAEDPVAKLAGEVQETTWNRAFEATAAGLKPALKTWPRRPLHLISFHPDENQYFKVKARKDRDISELPNMTWRKDDDFVLDFGIHMVGSLAFKLDYSGAAMDAPCRLRLTFGESPLDVTLAMDNVKTWISTAWLPDEVINVDVCPRTVTLERRYSFRYLRVQVIDTSPKFKVSFSDVECKCVAAVGPDDTLEDVEYEDDVLQHIDTVSITTLRDCMQTVFEDGPRRDRRLWIGDLRLQAQANYCTFRDFYLVKRCIYLFAAVPRSDGSVPACVFETPHFIPSSDYIVDYDALLAATISDYVAASNDLQAGHELYPTALSCATRALTYLDPTTHTFDPSRRNDGWLFLDWQPTLDRTAGMHGLVLYVLKSINTLATHLSKPPPFLPEVTQLTASATRFLSPNQLFTSGPTHQISYASAAWLVLSGAFPAATARTALLNTLAHPEAVKPLTPYLWHHVCDALATCGAVEECIDTIKTYWGGMLSAGADTFWEAFDPENHSASPYGDVRNNSFCHAWSCTPVWLLRERLGLQAVRGTRIGRVSMRELDERWMQKTTGELGGRGQSR